VYGKHLGRDKDERRNLFKGLVQSLFTYGTIQTSEAKAKAIKALVDKVVNLAKDKNKKHLLAAYLVNKDLLNRLVSEIVPKLDGRTSGYTSLVRLGARFGDQTMMVKMSLIGAEQLKPILVPSLRAVAKQSSNSKKEIATLRQAQGKLPRNDKRRVTKRKTAKK